MPWSRITLSIMWTSAVDAIIVLMYFVVVTLLFSLLAKHSSAALPCSDLLTVAHYSYTTPKLLALQLQNVFTVQY